MAYLVVYLIWGSIGFSILFFIGLFIYLYFFYLKCCCCGRTQVPCHIVSGTNSDGSRQELVIHNSQVTTSPKDFIQRDKSQLDEPTVSPVASKSEVNETSNNGANNSEDNPIGELRRSLSRREYVNKKLREKFETNVEEIGVFHNKLKRMSKRYSKSFVEPPTTVDQPVQIAKLSVSFPVDKTAKVVGVREKTQKRKLSAVPECNFDEPDAKIANYKIEKGFTSFSDKSSSFKKLVARTASDPTANDNNCGDPTPEESKRNRLKSLAREETRTSQNMKNASANETIELNESEDGGTQTFNSPESVAGVRVFSPSFVEELRNSDLFKRKTISTNKVTESEGKKRCIPPPKPLRGSRMKKILNLENIPENSSEQAEHKKKIKEPLELLAMKQQPQSTPVRHLRFENKIRADDKELSEHQKKNLLEIFDEIPLKNKDTQENSDTEDTWL